MLKLPWHQQVWLWLLVASLAIPLIFNWKVILAGNVLNSGVNIFIIFTIYSAAIWIWSMWTTADRRIIRTEKNLLARVSKRVKAFNKLTDLNLNSNGVVDVMGFGVICLSPGESACNYGFEDYKNTLSRDQPEFYLVYITCIIEEWSSADDKKRRNVTVHELGYRKGHTKYWKIINEHLVDLNRAIVSVDFEDPESVLTFIKRYKNVGEAALAYYRIIGAPILKNTKIENHGNSENLRMLREFMENPEIMFQSTNVDYKKLL